jgi:outer membrane immunogenic protein
MLSCKTDKLLFGKTPVKGGLTIDKKEAFMKRTFIIICSILLSLLCSQVYGLDNYYGRISLGLALPSESDMTDSTAPGTTIKAESKTNGCASAAFGSDFGKIRGEIELAYQQNEFDNAFSSGSNRTIDGEISAISYLFNLYYDLDNNTNFTPYITAGVGLTSLHIKDFSLPAAGTDPAFSSTSEDDIEFTYQIGCGVSYAIERNISIDINYRRFTPSDPAFNTLQSEFESNNFYVGLRISF